MLDGSSIIRNLAREPVAEHRSPAFRFGFGRLVLKHVPVLGKATVFDPDHVDRSNALSDEIRIEAAD
jgi:hypothetical protein